MSLNIGWLTAFIDRPAQSFGAAEAFWLAVTGSSLSPRRGPTDQFATLLPNDGDAYLRVQRVDSGPGGCHLDIHVADLATSAATAVEFGATVVSELDDVTVAHSPAGMTFCIVGHRGESTRPRPVGTPGARALVDQLSVDVPPALFGRECEFWAALTGWELTASPARPEFAVLARQVGLPLRLLLHRLDDPAAKAAGAHLDLACDDPDTTAERHVALGATVVETHRFWTVMADPTGMPYCLTRRNPDTGQLA